MASTPRRPAPAARPASPAARPVLEDLEGRRLMSASYLAFDRVVLVEGTTGNDDVRVQVGSRQAASFGGFTVNVKTLEVFEGGQRTLSVDFNLVSRVKVAGSWGHDKIDCSMADRPCTIYGGNGYDLIYGSNAADHIYPGPDTDTVKAGAGNDYISDEGGGADVFVGGDGYDVVRCAQHRQVFSDVEEVRWTI